jgi:hypothetical protein
MRQTKLAFVVAAAMLLMACSKAGTNTNGNTSKPANTNTQTKTASSTPAASTGAKSAVLPTSTTASGENVYTHSDAGIQIEAPPTWKTEAEGDTITLTAPDNSISLVLTVVENADVAQAAAAIDSELEKVLKNAEPDGPVSEETNNGLKIYSQSGKGEISGNQVLWGSALIMAKKPVLAYTFAAPGLFEQHAADVGKLIDSIKPAN